MSQTRSAVAMWRAPSAMPLRVLALCLVAGALTPLTARAQGPAPSARQTRRQFNLPGALEPAAPEAPAVITRAENGRVVVRATKLMQPIVIDGVLDEAVYTEVAPVSDFIQTVPNEGAPASERTEAWIAYDDNNFYLSCRCWDSAPPEQ